MCLNNFQDSRNLVCWGLIHEIVLHSGETIYCKYIILARYQINPQSKPNFAKMSFRNSITIPFATKNSKWYGKSHSCIFVCLLFFVLLKIMFAGFFVVPFMLMIKMMMNKIDFTMLRNIKVF